MKKRTIAIMARMLMRTDRPVKTVAARNAGEIVPKSFKRPRQTDLEIVQFVSGNLPFRPISFCENAVF
jgi:hypothetical protein